MPAGSCYAWCRVNATRVVRPIPARASTSGSRCVCNSRSTLFLHTFLGFMHTARQCHLLTGYWDGYEHCLVTLPSTVRQTAKRTDIAAHLNAEV